MSYITMDTMNKYDKDDVRGSIIISYSDKRVNVQGGDVPMWVYLELIDVLELRGKLATHTLKSEMIYFQTTRNMVLVPAWYKEEGMLVSVHDSYHLLHDKAVNAGATLIIQIRKDGS